MMSALYGALVILTKAFVLHRQAYRETSLLVDFFTSTHGRLSGIAKGAKRPKSPWRGLLEPLQTLIISWTGPRELKTVTAVELEVVFPPLLGPRLFTALYLNELLMRLLQRELPFPELFDAYAGLLQQLRDPSADVEPLLRFFELALLQTLGYGIDLLHHGDNQCPVVANKYYRYVAELGLVEAAEPKTALCCGATLLALAARQLTNERHRLEAKRLLRLLLQQHLGSQPLQSRLLWSQQYPA